MRLPSFLLEVKPLLELATSIAGFVAAVLLGVMAILLSRAANRIAASELELAERQTIVAEHQLQPRFRFEEEELPDAKGSLLRLFNDGAPVESFSLEQITFIELNQNDRGTHDSRLLPTYYYGDRLFTGSLTGLLATFSPSWLMVMGEPRSSAEHLLELEEEIRSWRPGVTTCLRPFIVIYYTDSLGRAQEVTYEIHPRHGPVFGPVFPRRLSDGHATAVRNLFWPMPPQPLYMLTGEMIKERWASYPAAGRLDELDVANNL